VLPLSSLESEEGAACRISDGPLCNLRPSDYRKLWQLSIDSLVPPTYDYTERKDLTVLEPLPTPVVNLVFNFDETVLALTLHHTNMHEIPIPAIWFNADSNVLRFEGVFVIRFDHRSLTQVIQPQKGKPAFQLPPRYEFRDRMKVPGGFYGHSVTDVDMRFKSPVVVQSLFYRVDYTNADKIEIKLKYQGETLNTYEQDIKEHKRKPFEWIRYELPPHSHLNVDTISVSKGMDLDFITVQT
jgi:hypothetical protein